MPSSYGASRVLVLNFLDKPFPEIFNLVPTALKTKKSVNSPKVYVKCVCFWERDATVFIRFSERLAEGPRNLQAFLLPHSSEMIHPNPTEMQWV